MPARDDRPPYDIAVGAAILGIWEGTAVRGYLLAAERAKVALAEKQPDDAQIAVYEAASWVDTITQRFMASDVLRGFVYLRHRTHHGWASAIRPDRVHGWVWRGVEELTPPEPGHEHLARRACYRNEIELRPVVQTLERIGAEIESICHAS
jgi:hypothetical protein